MIQNGIHALVEIIAESVVTFNPSHYGTGPSAQVIGIAWLAGSIPSRNGPVQLGRLEVGTVKLEGEWICRNRQFHQFGDAAEEVREGMDHIRQAPKVIAEAESASPQAVPGISFK